MSDAFQIVCQFLYCLYWESVLNNHYVDRSQWHIIENVHEPVISRSDFETVQRILGNAPVKRPNGDGEIQIGRAHV